MAKTKVDQWLNDLEKEAGLPSGGEATGLMPLDAQLPVAGLGAPLPSSGNGDALANLWSPAAKGSTQKRSVEDLLFAEGKIDAEKLQQAKAVHANSRGKKISQVLMEMGAVGEEDVQQALATVLS